METASEEAPGGPAAFPREAPRAVSAERSEEELGQEAAAEPSPVRAVPGNLFLGLPPLLMLLLGVVVGAAVGIAVGVVVWTLAG